MATDGGTDGLRLRDTSGRWVVFATVAGSTVVFLEATVVNVALPAIGRSLAGGVAGRQWVVTGYLLSLSALILLGGSLGDRFGRRRVFTIGLVWFTVASVLCAVAPTLPLLIAAEWTRAYDALPVLLVLRGLEIGGVNNGAWRRHGCRPSVRKRAERSHVRRGSATARGGASVATFGSDETANNEC